MKNIVVFLLLFLLSLNTHSIENSKRQVLVKFLSDLRVNYKRVNDYSATMKLENFQKDYQLQIQKMWFKKPGFLLLEQLGPFKEGAILAIKPDGEIKGHLGGFLSFAVISLSKNNSNMFGVTQDSALNTDYDKIIDIAMSLIDEVSDYSIKETNNTFILDTYYSNKISQIRLIVDKKNGLIVGLQRFIQDKMIHKIQWFDLKTNLNMSTEKFTL